jgi:hypothetical protein
LRRVDRDRGDSRDWRPFPRVGGEVPPEVDRSLLVVGLNGKVLGVDRKNE